MWFVNGAIKHESECTLHSLLFGHNVVLGTLLEQSCILCCQAFLKDPLFVSNIAASGDYTTHFGTRAT